MPSNQPKLILASGSPRRQELMRELGFTFDVQPQDLDETPLKGEKPRTYVCRIAREKAISAAKKNAGNIVLAADTSVALGRRIFGKPESADGAAAMLRQMSGRRHRVMTAVVVVDAEGKVHEDMTSTTVKLRPLQEKDIKNYVANPKNWQGLAGSYAVQSAAGGSLAKAVNGSISGIVGLPLVETLNLLKRCGFESGQA